jgi:tetratricopeptide (TPR) repeat protein
MQSADLRRWISLAALGAALSGCAALSDSYKGLKEAVSGTSSNTAASAGSAAAPSAAPAAAAAAAAPSPSASALPAAPSVAAALVVEPEAPQAVPEPPPVDPAARRAFDDARRALRAGRTAEAERAFKALTLSHPELGGAHANLGLIHRRAGKLAQAIAELEKAVAASPGQPVFHNQLGIAYRENGQFAKAREAYERALALDANYAAPHLNLGILHDLYLWDGKRALELYARYLELSPGGDTTVVKWVADLKNRKPRDAMLAKKEKE